MEQLQGIDASFVAMEQRNTPMHIGTIQIYDPNSAPGELMRFKDILKFFEERMHLSKIIRRRLVKVPMDIDYPYWVEDADFDLEYHLRHLALPKPGDWRQLCIQTARIFSRPLDMTRPPWEFTVIEGLNNVSGIPEGSFAIVTKVHHAAIDGMSGIDLLEATHTISPSAELPDLQDDWKADRVPDPMSLMVKGFMNAWANPTKFFGAVMETMPGVYRVAKGIRSGNYNLEAVYKTPKTRFNVTASPHRVIEGRQFPLQTLKELRKLVEGAKVNDVFLTIVGGALRKYLIAKNELPDSTLTAMAPISVRTTGEKNAMGNEIATMVAPLGTLIDNPIERLEYVYEETKNSKAMINALGARKMSELSKASPALFLALGARMYSEYGLSEFVKPPFNTVVTNVPGPPIPLYSAGAKLVSMRGLFCLLDGVTLGHVVQSYMDEATITFTACRKVMPDPEFYSQCLQDSFDEMVGAATVKPAKNKAVSPAQRTKVTKSANKSNKHRKKVSASKTKKKPKRSNNKTKLD